MNYFPKKRFAGGWLALGVLALVCPLNLAVMPVCGGTAMETAGPALLPGVARTNTAALVPQDLWFSHLTVADGLSDSTMSGVVQDRQGYMWFGTSWGGLNRYDGYEFKVYQNDAKDPRSLSQNNVTVLFLDHLGVLWVGTEAGGLNRYDRDTDDFTRYRPVPGDDTSLCSGLVRAICEDDADGLWVGTENGLSRLDRATGKFRTYHRDPQNPRSLSADSVGSLLYDPATGQLWAGTKWAGVCVLGKDSSDWTTYAMSTNLGSISGNNGVTLFKDRAGTVWIGTDRGLNRFVPASGTFVRYQHDPADTNSLSDNYVRAIYEDRRGRFWIGTGDGVELMDRAQGIFSLVPAGSPDAQHLLSSLVGHICEDNSGAIWFADVEQGVSRLDSEPPKFITYGKSSGETDGLGHEFVLGMFADRNDRVWVGTMGGLDFLEKGRPPVRHVHFPQNLAPRVHAVAEDGQGGYWVGAFPEGLFHLQGDEPVRLAANPDDPTRPLSDQIWAFAKDPRRGLWILYWWVGMDYFDGHTFTRYHTDPGNPQRLHEGTFLGCVTDDQGLIWLAGPSGLARLDPADGVFTTFQIDQDHPEDEVNRSIACVFADRKSPGEIWIGGSSGLYQFDKKSGRFVRHYVKRDGLCADGVQAIQRDDQGCLWLGTLNGLSRFDPQRITFRNYDLVDGLPGKKFFNGAAAKTSDGRLFFGTTKGLMVFDPSRMPDNPYPPPVVLTGFELFNKPVAIGGRGSPLRQAINVADEIVLSYRQSDFTFKFAALNFTAPEKNLYAYKMEGFDDDWRYTDAQRRFATYTRLPAGHYTFRVKASNNDGVWNERGVALTVIIIPPWWLTWWFRGATIAALLALIVAVHQWRTRQIKKRSETLERLVAARTAELRTANQELESFSYSVSHDLRAPLRAIDGFSRIVLEDNADQLNAEGRGHLERVRAASHRMGQLIDDLLNLSRVTRSELHRGRVNLSDLAAQVAAELRQANPDRPVEIIIQPALVAEADANLLRIVLENLLGNAWKFTAKQPAPRIEFGQVLRNGAPAFFVRDNGAGFDMAHAGKMFGAFQRLHRAADFPGTGIGLATVQRIIHRHGGEVVAEGMVGQGATFYFSLPPDTKTL